MVNVEVEIYNKDKNEYCFCQKLCEIPSNYMIVIDITGEDMIIKTTGDKDNIDGYELCSFKKEDVINYWITRD